MHKALGGFHLTAYRPVNSGTDGEDDAGTLADVTPPAGLATSDARILPRCSMCSSPARELAREKRKEGREGTGDGAQFSEESGASSPQMCEGAFLIGSAFNV